jgi:hypothetical protein
MRGPNTGDTLTLPVGNYLSDALRNYVSENPSDLRNFMSADNSSQVGTVTFYCDYLLLRCTFVAWRASSQLCWAMS